MKFSHGKCSTSQVLLSLAYGRYGHHYCCGGGYAQDEEDDFCPAPWSFTLHFSCSAVDEEAVGLVAVAICAYPYGQEYVLERNVVVLRADGMDALLVAADIAPDKTADMGVHGLLGMLETVAEVHLVAFGAKAA